MELTFVITAILDIAARISYQMPETRYINIYCTRLLVIVHSDRIARLSGYFLAKNVLVNVPKKYNEISDLINLNHIAPSLNEQVFKSLNKSDILLKKISKQVIGKILLFQLR